MKYQETCPHCGQIITAYTHNINKPMAYAFVTFMQEYERTRRPVNINSGLSITHNQICNMPKLQYYGLIKRLEGEGWIPTERGILWYKGEAAIETPVATMSNRVLPDNHPAWATHKKGRTTVTLESVTGFRYKQRDEYQAEKSRQGEMGI
jgi:hypothetical protein